MDYFSADFHLGHFNIIEYCNRPFKTTEEMNSFILNEVNEVVMPSDRLIILGDVAFKRAADMLGSWRGRINCENVWVVPGNHDKVQVLNKHFKVLPLIYEHVVEDYRLILSHYRMDVWPHAHHGAGHLYGHSHGKLKPKCGPDGRGLPAFDVGVDCWGYKPLSLIQVKAEMKRRTSVQMAGVNYESSNYEGTNVKEHHGAL